MTVEIEAGEAGFEKRSGAFRIGNSLHCLSWGGMKTAVIQGTGMQRSGLMKSASNWLFFFLKLVNFMFLVETDSVRFVGTEGHSCIPPSHHFTGGLTHNLRQMCCNVENPWSATAND